MLFAATWMDLECVILSEVSQTEKKKCHILYIWNLKGNDTNKLTKEKKTHRLREWTYDCQGEGIVRELEIDMYTLLYLKWKTNKAQLHTTWKSSEVKLLSRARLFVTPWTVACTKLLHPWDFLGKSTGVGCHFLLQGLFPTQGSNPGLPHCSQTLYRLSHVAARMGGRFEVEWLHGYMYGWVPSPFTYNYHNIVN